MGTTTIAVDAGTVFAVCFGSDGEVIDVVHRQLPVKGIEQGDWVLNNVNKIRTGSVVFKKGSSPCSYVDATGKEWNWC